MPKYMYSQEEKSANNVEGLERISRLYLTEAGAILLWDDPFVFLTTGRFHVNGLGRARKEVKPLWVPL